MFFKVLNLLGISLSTPRWLISLALFLQAGTRGISLGVRVVVFRADGAVFLVKHSYLNGWHFPGGGVERREIVEDAAKRELREEARIRARGALELVGLFLSNKYRVPDYIALVCVRDWEWDSPDGSQPKPQSLDGEIIDGCFFMPDALPDDVSPATRRRIGELVGEKHRDGVW